MLAYMVLVAEMGGGDSRRMTDLASAVSRLLFFGLTLRQFLCALGAVAVALAVYFFLGPALGGSDVGWACVLAAAPFALCGFYRYNSMTFEQFILAVIRSELLYPKRLVFKSDHLYTKALENATIKEALKLD